MSYDLNIKGLGDHLSIGRIHSVNPNTHTVNVYLFAGRHAGRTPECTIPTAQKNEMSRSGILILPEVGDEVYVDWSKGPTPSIGDHVPNVFQTEKKKEYKTQITPIRGFGGEDKFHANSGEKPYRFGPTDMMPGDKVFMGKWGNFIGVLSGGLTILKGGPLSQIILSKWRDTVKVVSRNFELFSDFGRIRMLSKKGLTSFELVGNATAQKSNGHKESDWDYVMRLGGKNLFELNLMRDKFNFSVDEDGQINLKSARSANITLAAAPNLHITGNQSVNVDGSKNEFYTGDKQKVVRGLDTENVSRKVFVCTGAKNSVVSGPETRSCLRAVRESIRGTAITDLLSTVGKETRIGAGDFEIHIGNPLDLGTPSPALLTQGKTGSYKLSVFLGDIDFAVATKGNIGFSTRVGDINGQTLKGDVALNTVVGNASLTTFAGDVELSTLKGAVSLTTLVGDCELSTGLGDVTVKSVLGKVRLEASPLCFLELSPTGIKLSHAGVDVMAQIQELLTTLSTTAAPGYGGPITTVAQFGAQLGKWLLCKGG